MPKIYHKVKKGRCRCGSKGEVVVRGIGKDERTEEIVGYHCFARCGRTKKIGDDNTLF